MLQVSPQFDISVAAAPSLRRRRKCQSATSFLDGCSQLSRKNSVCKFPSLVFQTRSKDQSRPPKCTKKVAEPTVVSNAGNQPQGSCQNKKTVSSAQHVDTPKRQLASTRKRNDRRFSGGAESSSRCLDQPEPQTFQQRKCKPPAVSASTPAFSKNGTSEFSEISPAPDVDTPKVIQEGSSCPPSPGVHLLLAELCTPPCNQPPDILVADTPERDYGLKVTWRRRRGLMLLLKDRGHLSDSDVLIKS